MSSGRRARAGEEAHLRSTLAVFVPLWGNMCGYFSYSLVRGD